MRAQTSIAATTAARSVLPHFLHLDGRCWPVRAAEVCRSGSNLDASRADLAAFGGTVLALGKGRNRVRVACFRGSDHRTFSPVRQPRTAGPSPEKR